MPHYSFKVRSPEDLVLPKYLITIGEGIDVLSVLVPDLNEFKADLQEYGVEILEENRLDEFDPVPVDPAVAAALSGAIPPELIALGYDPMQDTNHSLQIDTTRFSKYLK